MTDPDLVIVSKLDNLQDKVSKMEKAIERLADAMVQIARMEVLVSNQSEDITRAFSEIHELGQRLDKHFVAADDRLRALEDANSVHKLVSGWVVTGVSSLLAALGGAVLALVYKG